VSRRTDQVEIGVEPEAIRRTVTTVGQLGRSETREKAGEDRPIMS
jgi:hypothetical protein